MVEVFKTNVQEVTQSKMIIQQLLEYFPNNKINFDLSDCDRILRVEGDIICSETIMQLVSSGGYHWEVLL
ncbi:MAG: hypothetical protein ABIS69_07610 [Sediminibacterium sp.]